MKNLKDMHFVLDINFMKWFVNATFQALNGFGIKYLQTSTMTILLGVPFESLESL